MGFGRGVEVEVVEKEGSKKIHFNRHRYQVMSLSPPSLSQTLELINLQFPTYLSSILAGSQLPHPPVLEAEDPRYEVQTLK